MQLRFLIPALVLSFAVAATSGPAAAQPGAEGPPGLFKGAGETGPQAMNAVGQKRMATLKQDSTNQSIRLVRIAGNLSQRRTLVMHVGANRALAPEVPPAFQREHSGQERRSGQRTKLLVRRERINPIDENTYAWIGTVQTNPAKETVGDVILIHGEDGSITGTIRFEAEVYKVRPLSGGVHGLVDVDESKYSMGGGSPLHSGRGAPDASTGSASSAGSGTRTHPSTAPQNETCPAATASIAPTGAQTGRGKTSVNATESCPQKTADVLAVYTSAAAEGRDVDGIIHEAIQASNFAYANSSAWGTHVSLVHSEQIGFIETDNLGNDIDVLQNNSTVQSLRYQYDADVVVLLGEYSGAGLADELRAEAGDAYAIVGVSRAAGGGLVFPHEVGHLQGGQHHPDDPTCPPTGQCAADPEGHRFPDAYGHRFSAGGNDYATVMAYTNFGAYTRIKRFSNPSETFDGQPTGTSSRNNVNALDITHDAVEGFRISDDLRASMTVSGTDSDHKREFTATPCGGTGSYSYEWRVSYDGPGNYGPPVSTHDTFSDWFPEGTHYVKLTVKTASQTDTEIRTVTIGDGGIILSKSSTTKTKTPPSDTPERVALSGADPNPVRSAARVRYALPERTDVTLAVYDLMGRKVATLATGARSAGTHRARLDGSALASGVYVLRLRAGSKQKTRRIMVVK